MLGTQRGEALFAWKPPDFLNGLRCQCNACHGKKEHFGALWGQMQGLQNASISSEQSVRHVPYKR